MARINKLFKLIDDRPVLHLDGRQFNDLVIPGRQPRCFGIEDNIGGVFQIDMLFVVCNWGAIFNDVRFNTV